jgi:hypothetical protein
MDTLPRLRYKEAIDELWRGRVVEERINRQGIISPVLLRPQTYEVIGRLHRSSFEKLKRNKRVCFDEKYQRYLVQKGWRQRR